MKVVLMVLVNVREQNIAFLGLEGSFVCFEQSLNRLAGFVHLSHRGNKSGFGVDCFLMQDSPAIQRYAPSSCSARMT